MTRRAFVRKGSLHPTEDYRREQGKAMSRLTNADICTTEDGECLVVRQGEELLIEQVWEEEEVAGCWYKGIYICLPTEELEMTDRVMESPEQHLAKSILATLDIILPDAQPNPETSHVSVSYLKWMAYQVRDGGFDKEKANRWIGFIQGVLVARNLTTVEHERERTRRIVKPSATV